VDIIDGFVRVKHTGTGIMLIERKVLETMRERFPNLWMANPPAHIRDFIVRNGGPQDSGYLQCFETLPDKDGIAYGEDVSFCLRWVKGCEGEIWANVDEAIVHIGNEVFVGQYITKLKSRPDLKLNMVSSAETTSIVPPVEPGPGDRRPTRKERRAFRRERV
jgi:hypothetical protein